LTAQVKEMHIADVINLIEELTNLLLCGHS
jgi:hypothetical protein